MLVKYGEDFFPATHTLDKKIRFHLTKVKDQFQLSWLAIKVHCCAKKATHQ